jgi:AbrB family looped-hinge helix DNA binding protein
VHRTKVDAKGRVLLPAAVRRTVGLRGGSKLIVTVEEGGRIVLVPPATAWTRIQALFDGLSPQRSVVDELLEERRADAASEADA